MSNNKIRIDLQLESDALKLPEQSLFQQWVEAALQSSYQRLEQTLRIVDEDESRQLNNTFRHQDRPTNVLSFPAQDSEFLDYDCLGDLVLCAPVIQREAQEQGKSLEAHWAHMIVHGMLHLQGFDHLNEADAQQMETLEIEILAALGHTNPYLTIE